MLADEGMQGDKLLTPSFSPIDRSGSHRGHRGLFDVTSFSPGQVKIEVSVMQSPRMAESSWDFG